mgnify:FL=1
MTTPQTLIVNGVELPIIQNGWPSTYLHVGDKVFYPTSSFLIVECPIVETSEVINCPRLNETIWHNTYEDGTTKVLVPSKKKDECGWPIWRKATRRDLEGCTVVNQFLWIDEPVGHSIHLEDECFLTLKESKKAALQHIRSNVKHEPKSREYFTRDLSIQDMRRILYYSRWCTRKFIASTHKKTVAEMKFPRLPPRQIFYVRLP